MVSIYQSALFVAFFLVIATSVLIAAILNIKKIVPYLVIIYLLSFSNILFTGEIAGLLNSLNNRLFFLLLHIVLLMISFLIWKKRGAPVLFSPVKSFWKTLRTINLWKVVKSNPFLSILGIFVVLMYAFGAILVLVFPPNNYDSMTCHMARIGYWLQQGNFLPWSTWFSLQVEYPINAQVQVLWSILFWRTDTFAGFTQWFASVFSIIAIYGIARQFKRSRSQALFACLIYSLFPEILLQSTTTMTHLLGATLIIIAFYFLFMGFSDRSAIYLCFSGLSISLAMGVHLMVFFAIPGFAISALFLVLRNRKVFQKSLLWISISTLLSFLIFSSLIYIQNFYFYKNPLGSYAVSNPWSISNSNSTNKPESYWNINNLLKYTYINTSRYIFASYDLTGLPKEIAQPLVNLRNAVFIPVFKITNNPLKSGEFDINAIVQAVDENQAWFGIVSFFLFYPLMIIELVSAIKKRESVPLILIFNILLYTFIWSGLISRENSWSKYSGRYFVPVALLFAPLISCIYRKGIGYKLLSAIIVAASIFISIQTISFNYAKPVGKYNDIFSWNRQDKMYSVSRDQQYMVRAVEGYLPRGTLGLALTSSFMEYPFFGEYFQRTLVPIYPYEKMNDEQWLNSKEVNWIITCVDTKKPNGFIEVESYQIPYPPTECRLFKRE